MTTMRKRTTLITKDVMVQIKPRNYLKFLSKVNKDIDKVDNDDTIEQTFNVAIIGEKLVNYPNNVELSDVNNCNDGTMFIVCKN